MSYIFEIVSQKWCGLRLIFHRKIIFLISSYKTMAFMKMKAEPTFTVTLLTYIFGGQREWYKADIYQDAFFI